MLRTVSVRCTFMAYRLSPWEQNVNPLSGFDDYRDLIAGRLFDYRAADRRSQLSGFRAHQNRAPKLFAWLHCLKKK